MYQRLIDSWQAYIDCSHCCSIFTSDLGCLSAIVYLPAEQSYNYHIKGISNTWDDVLGQMLWRTLERYMVICVSSATNGGLVCPPY